MARVVLVTGVSSYLGAEVAGVLRHEPGIERLIGVTGPEAAGGEGEPPAHEQEPGPDGSGHADGAGRADGARRADGADGAGRVDGADGARRADDEGGAGQADEQVVRLDVRTGQIGSLIRATGADTVVHLGLVATPSRTGGRASMKETNVIGAMQLLNACQRSETVRKLVVRSSTAVYGTSPRSPAVFTEEMEPRASHGYAKDVLDVEGYVRGLARRRPDITISVLRFVNFLGPSVDSPLTRYFSLPVAPTVLGYDPRIQFVDISDGREVIRRTVAEDHPGTFNVTGRGAMVISQCVRRAGCIPVAVPAPALGIFADFGRGLFPDVSPDQRELLRYGRVVDGTKLERELGWAPRHTSADAFARFVAGRRPTRNCVAAVVDRLLAEVLHGADGKPR
jgi:UDP-glucose 4-epimerase